MHSLIFISCRLKMNSKCVFRSALLPPRFHFCEAKKAIEQGVRVAGTTNMTLYCIVLIACIKQNIFFYVLIFFTFRSEIMRGAYVSIFLLTCVYLFISTLV